MRKCEVLGMLNHGFSSILLGNYSVGAFFAFLGKVMNNYWKCMPKWLPKCSKIELGGALGLKFWGFGRFWEDVDFRWVLGGAKSRPKMTKVRHLGGKNEKGAPILGGSASRAVVLGRVFRAVLQVLGQVLQNSLTRLAPPSKDGVGGFKGYRLCRRPLLNQVLAILCDL